MQTILITKISTEEKDTGNYKSQRFQQRRRIKGTDGTNYTVRNRGERYRRLRISQKGKIKTHLFL